MNDAYNEAYREAEDEYGHQQGYSGHINCTRLTRDITTAYKAAKNKNEFIEEMHEKQGKGDCYGVELSKPVGNTNKVKTTVEITPQKGAKQWETRFVVETFDAKQVASEKTQGAAVKKAREYCEKHQATCRVYLTKVMVKGVSFVATIRYKPCKSQKEGEYLFIYSAPE
jgi:hypothetical protein